MWKLLRNLVILAVLCVAVLKLVLWYEVQQGAARLAARLAPVAQLQYADVGAGLDGAVTLGGVTVTVTRDHAREVWRASRLDLGTPGALWLVRRLLLDDDSLPEHLSVAVSGLQSPATAFGTAAAAVNPLSMVPFETLGCGIVSRFSVADYQRMGLNPGAQQQRLEYRYDASAATLTLTADLASPPFSTINAHLELQKFDPRQLAGNWQKLHASEIGVSYADGGYLAKRNRFCAQQAGITPAQFLDQHIAAVDALLRERGIQPSAPVEALYRALVAEGGRVSLLSLPPAASTVGQLLAETPDVMMRQLNLTARRNDAPPLMVRIAFVAPAEATATAEAAPAAAVEPAKPAGSPSAAAAAPAPPAPKPPAAPAAAPNAAVTASAPPVVAKAPAPVVTTRPATTAATAGTAVNAAHPPASVAPAAPTPAKPAATAATANSAGKPDGNAPPSAAPPPEGSTLALVWKPGVDVDRVGPATTARDYDVVDFAALSAGRFVRLVTKTGKKVEGRVIGVDNAAVGMRIQRPGGSADLQIPRDIIVEIQVPHRRAGDEQG